MVWKMTSSQGKVSEKSGNFETEIEWQCLIVISRYFLDVQWL